jgi:membrane fusion protein, copper/silver efflux system
MKRLHIYLVIALLTGLFIGWLIFRPSAKEPLMTINTAEESVNSVWTCAMHPQIRMAGPGKCPICGMELIPLTGKSSASIDPDEVHMSREALQLANVLTSLVSRQVAVKEIRLYGKVQFDERLLQSQVAHVSGRIEKLGVNFTGETVSKGQLLAQIYSPELIVAQKELIESAKTKETQPAVFQAARERLIQWKLTDNQIETILESGTTQNNFEVFSNTSGVVTARQINTGDYVSRGTILFQIADLSRVWVMFDAYESDLQFLHKGEEVTFTLDSWPGSPFKGNIKFIDPVIDPVTRVAKVRVETNNASGMLKPEMFASGIVLSTLGDKKDKVVIPKSAVLWTGKRSIVYIRQPGTDEYIFKMREVELGPEVGDSYVIESGLSEGENIVTSGTFSIDAAAQLEGKTSMMNSPEKENNNLVNATFHVSGNCELCKGRIEEAARSVQGVSKAVWNMNKKDLEIYFDSKKTDIISIHKAVAKAGHDTDLIKAEDDVYKSLPECCRYRTI